MGIFCKPNIKKLKAKKNVGKLIKALSHKDSKIRQAAAKALGSIRDIRVVNPLITALLDEEKRVREESEKALSKLTGEMLGADYKNWEMWWNKNKYNRQILRYPIRLKRAREWEAKEKGIENKISKRKPPQDVSVAIHRLLYGDFFFDAERERRSLKREIENWEKSLEKELESELSIARKALEKKWRAQEAEWRKQDEAWFKKQEIIEKNSKTIDRKYLCRCPSCDADLYERYIIKYGDHYKCAFCYGEIPHDLL